MLKRCHVTGKEFEVTDTDLSFLDKISPIIGDKKYAIPTPSLCPEERQRRRMASRNERSLYHRKCDKTGEAILSVYHEDCPFPVYKPDIWYGDTWDGKDYGQDFDFNKTFFEQFAELRDKVPHLSLIAAHNVNCDFCNVVGKSKNCFLIFGSINCEDCYYGSPFNCKDCSDSLLLRNSQLCCECMDSNNLYNCYFCQNCNNSQDLRFCFGVDNSSNCFACVDLNRKQYCILNKQYSKEEYARIVNNINLGSPSVFAEIMKKFEELKMSVPHRAYIGTNNEGVSGNYIFHSKDAYDSYNVEKCQDVRYASQLIETKDGMDVDYGEYGQLMYESMGYFNSMQNILFSYFNWDTCYNLLYCGNCTQSTKNSFGCVSLKRSEYCILNKQYTKEEYEKLMPKIIEHMQETGEWGEFFPIADSPFAYNETVAQEFYPITKQIADENGWKWRDNLYDMHTGEAPKIPTNLDEVSDDFTSKVLKCEKTGRVYKVIPQELNLYRKMRIPIPKTCADQRHIDRLKRRNPRQLWDRTCAKCSERIKTSYSPERPEVVYCESCYATEIY